MQTILINPPVYDFALHDFWLKPFGLLRIAKFLKLNKIDFYFFDFLYKYHPQLNKIWKPKVDKYGRGKFFYKIVEKPEILKFVKRNFKRYGIPLEIFEEELKNKDLKIAFISTGMTYWYLGVKEIINFLRKNFRNIKIFAGGIYANLCPKHAQKMGIDKIIKNFEELAEVLKDFGFKIKYFPEKIEEKILPEFDLYDKKDYIAVRLIKGCPFRCKYCASWIIDRKIVYSDIQEIAKLIEKSFYKEGIKNFAFYDDALLLNYGENLKKLKKILKKDILENIKFHTPNALHLKFINQEVAYLLKEMNFETIYLGVEYLNLKKWKKLGLKYAEGDFEKALKNLEKAGFKKSQITAYILMGLPGQHPKEVEDTIKIVHEYGIKIMLSEYSPIPQTPLGDFTIKKFKLNDLLLTNCSVFPIINWGEETVNELKNLKNQLNLKLREH